MDQHGPVGGEEQLRRVAALLREIEEEAMRLADGARGASPLAIVSRAASARRYLEVAMDQEPTADPAVALVGVGYVRRVRTAIHDLRLSAAAAANRVGVTEEEMAEVLRGFPGDLPLDLLERMARRLEAEQQLMMEPLLSDGGARRAG